MLVTAPGLLALSGCGKSNKKQPESKLAIARAVQQNTAPEPARNLVNVDTTGYKVFQIINPVPLPGSNVSSVTILQDKRLSGLKASEHNYPQLHVAQLRFVSDDEMMNPDVVFKPAMLIMKNQSGTILSSKLLDAPCARFDSVWLNESKTEKGWLLTVDYSIGMGSYNGPFTFFVRFANGGLVNFRGASGFTTSLKSEWVIKYTGGRMEVWSKTCRPGDGEDFDVITRKSWIVADSFASAAKVEKDFWESEGDSTAASLKEFLGGF